MSWGSSSRLVRRRNRPTFVTRGSSVILKARPLISFRCWRSASWAAVGFSPVSNSLEEYASALKPEDLLQIRADMDQLKAVLETEREPAKIKEALVRLEGSAYRIADAIYSASSGSRG